MIDFNKWEIIKNDNNKLFIFKSKRNNRYYLSYLVKINKYYLLKVLYNTYYYPITIINKINKINGNERIYIDNENYFTLCNIKNKINFDIIGIDLTLNDFLKNKKNYLNTTDFKLKNYKLNKYE
jgi:hypothetical protein